MTTLPELQARVRAATGADRELDARLAQLDGLNMTFCDFDTGCYHGDCESPGCGEPLGLHDERRSYPSDWREDERLPRYTASIDAALALVERLLPGWTRHITEWPPGMWLDDEEKPIERPWWDIEFWEPNVLYDENNEAPSGDGPTLALALLDALLGAMIAREGRE